MRKRPTPKPDAPTHIVDDCWDRYSRCGIKDPLPVVAAAHVEAHVEGRGMTLCPACAGGDQ